MNQEDLHRTTPSARNPKPLQLLGWSLKFNIYAPSRDGGVANIEKADGFVEGVLWEVDELDSLRRREGCPYVYQEHTLETAHGEATTFIATHPDPVEYKAADSYLDLILASATPISQAYRETIEAAKAHPTLRPHSPSWELILPTENQDTHLTFHNPLEAVGLAKMSEKVYDKIVKLIHLPSRTEYLLD
jgi:hypothetical protein